MLLALLESNNFVGFHRKYVMTIETDIDLTVVSCVDFKKCVFDNNKGVYYA